MQHLLLVQRLQTLHHLNQVTPDLVLRKASAQLLILGNFLIKISIVSILHDHIEGRGVILKEGFFVRDYVLVLNGR